MRAWAVSILLVVSWGARASAQPPIELRVHACDARPALLEALARVLRVELASGAGSRDVVTEAAAQGIEIRVDDCRRPGRVALVVRRRGRSVTRTIDLSDAEGDVAVRTLALVLVDLWSSLDEGEAGHDSPNARAQTDGGEDGRRRGAERHALGFALGPPAVTLAATSRGRGWALTPPGNPPDEATARESHASQGPRHVGDGPAVVLAVGFDGAHVIDPSTFFAGGRGALSMVHEGFVGSVAVAVHGARLGGGSAGMEVVAPSIELQAGGELRLDAVALGLSVGARAGYVHVTMQAGAPTAEPHVAQGGTLDFTLRARLRWDVTDVFGLEVASGIAYALLGYGHGPAIPGLRALSPWWVPLQLSATARL